jgi:hypothetical protein
MDREALLKAGLGSAEGCTRVRARVWRGNRWERHRRLRRAESFADLWAADGWGDGRASRGFRVDILVLWSSDGCADSATTISSISGSFGIAAVDCSRLCCIRWL